MLKKKFILIAMIAFASACTDVAPVVGEQEDVATTAQAAKKKKPKFDWCEHFGWYGDGICDEFCAQPDPDCAPAEQYCGVRGAAECGTGEYCHFEPEASCGAADAPGVCRVQPEFCTKEYLPVCGCDGVTYGNKCMAASAGVGIAAQGECAPTEPPAGTVCGGFAGQTCGTGEYCAFEPEAICGYADATGVCTTRPEACIQVYDPVCGCDGQTYGNACTAASAGVGVYAQGECATTPPTEKVCGGFSGQQCDTGEYCDYELDAICGIADATGICKPAPEVCTEQYEPVCGCNGQTYGNACHAASAGTGVMSEGECPAPPPGAFCGGFAGIQCAAGQYCDFAGDSACGYADMGGTCVASPEACIQVYDPVCGCDGKTYGNACTAKSYGTDVLHEGECQQ